MGVRGKQVGNWVARQHQHQNSKGPQLPAGGGGVLCGLAPALAAASNRGVASGGRKAFFDSQGHHHQHPQ